MTQYKNLTGKELNELWGVGARHALYHADGTWYHRLREFPGALFDANGYVVFQTREDYLGCGYLQIGEHTNVPGGISSIPGYVRVSEKGRLQQISRQIQKAVKQGSKSASQRLQVSDRKVILPPNPKPVDLRRPKHVQAQAYRVIRDTRVSRWVKYIHNYHCQLCGQTIQLDNDRLYAEAHHIRPLGAPHYGPDVIENVICVCPNCHVLLDYGAISLDIHKIITVSGHEIGQEYIEYHNTVIYEKGACEDKDDAS